MTFSALATTQDGESARQILEAYVNVNLASLNKLGGEAMERIRVRSLFGLLDAFVRDNRFSEYVIPR